jgi:DNA-binding NarL/FixJ family response regulator
MNTSSGSPIVVCHVEDHPVVAIGVRTIISESSRYLYAYHFTTAESFMSAGPLDPEPQLLLLDWYLPGLNADAILQWLQEQGKAPPVVLLSADEDLHLRVHELLTTNVRAFLKKDGDEKVLVEAMDKAMTGKPYFNEVVELGLTNTSAAVKRSNHMRLLHERWQKLAPRQKEYAVLATAWPHEEREELALRMKVSKTTLATYATLAHQQLDVKSRPVLMSVVLKLLHADLLKEHEHLLEGSWLGFRKAEG